MLQEIQNMLREIQCDPTYQPVEALWADAIYPGQLVLVTATYKSGKTSVLTSLFVNLALGRKWGIWTPIRPVKTFYIAFEDDEDDIQLILKCLGVSSNFRIFQREWTEHERTFTTEELKELVELYGQPDVIVLDPWMFGLKFDPREIVKMRESLKPFRRFARESSVCTILVHHDRKPLIDKEDDPWYSAAGAHTLGASIDAQWNIIKPKQGLRTFQITFNRKRRANLWKLLINYDKINGIATQYRGKEFIWHDLKNPRPPVGGPRI